MKRLAAMFLAVLAAGLSAKGAIAPPPEERPAVIAVPFDELKGMKTKSGESLDGSVNFYFMDEAGVPKTGAMDRSRSTTGNSGTGDRDACKRILLDAFVKLQRKAAITHWTGVCGVTTGYGDHPFSGARDQCQCGVGMIRISTEVRGYYTNLTGTPSGKKASVPDNAPAVAPAAQKKSNGAKQVEGTVYE